VDVSSAQSQGGMTGTMGSSPSNSADAHESALFQPYSTLDEPVMETIMRDVRAVYEKLKVVMLPLDRTVRLLGLERKILTFC
jgi:hypothetical protein